MTLNTNKENVVVNPLRNANGRRARSSRPASHLIIAREAARDPRRRRTLSPPLMAQHRSAHNNIPVVVNNDDMEVDSSTPSSSDEGLGVIQLPRRLRRPAFKDISPEALRAVDPNLEHTPLEYVREKLLGVGPQLWATAVSTTASPPPTRLPQELQVLIQDMSASLPTHLFAIYSKTSPRVTLHPTHGLVLAAHCANLPPVPPSRATSHAHPSSATTVLPVVPLCLPHPASFPTLLHYLYTKRPIHVLGWLLPPTTDTHQSRAGLSQHLAAMFTVHALLSHAGRVHGLWSNVVALGVFDDDLWKAIEIAWEVLLQALAATAGAKWQSPAPTPPTNGTH